MMYLESYRDSPVGLIPNDWDSSQIQSLCRIEYGKSPGEIKKTEFGNPIYGTGGVVGYTSASVCDGPSVLVGRKGTIDKVQYIESSFWAIDTTFYSTKHRGVLPEWLYRWLSNYDLRRLNEASGVPSLSRSSIETLYIHVPPLPEQKKIARILSSVDSKLALIDQQISTTKTLKKGLMQKLFSQGVGTQDADGQWQPHTEFQDTELGRIPVGWEVAELQNIAQSISVGIATSTTSHYVSDGVPLIRNQNILPDKLNDQDMLHISESFDLENKNKRLQRGDVLTVRTGYPGVTCVVPEKYIGAQTFTTLITRPKSEVIHPEFLSRYFNSPSGSDLMIGRAAGGAQQNINAGSLKNLLVPLPAMNEQKEIVRLLSMIDQKLEHLQSQKSQTQQLKKGLMQKLLTGQIRVKPDPQDV